ncbi:hypothetical protein ACFRAO_40420 [Streptomyces sp. NPDC056656]|uniref:hypothetical protein n=1 Tax=Streptomyces sp. NPDC056656 TaxID=3345895 RepID=UPI00369A8C20
MTSGGNPEKTVWTSSLASPHTEVNDSSPRELPPGINLLWRVRTRYDKAATAILNRLRGAAATDPSLLPGTIDGQ